MAAVASFRLVSVLIAGVFIGVLLQRLQVPTTQDPGSTPASTPASGATPSLPLLFLITPSAFMAMLRNSLQIAARNLSPTAYKRSGAALLSSLLHQTAPITTTPPSTTTTPSISLPTTSRAFSTTSPTMSNSKTFLEAIKGRRTIYALNQTSPISDKEITEIVKNVVLHVPSSFNSQSTRLVVLLKAEHEKFWDSVKEILKTMVPEEQFGATETKINGFRAAYGTVLFFEDPAPVRALQEAFPLYAHHFPDWSEHTDAMHQYALWTALEAEGFGASLQHYNPIIDRKAQETWNIPVDWKLRAQLVFGGRAGEAGEKTFKPVEGERLFVYGADA